MVLSSARPSLSVCCMTADPPHRVAAALEPLRLVADELVVAVDDRIDTGALGPLCRLADQVVRFRYRPPINRLRPWLASRCRGRWLLMVDGDEVPGAALVDRIPELLADPEVLQYRLARRWLWPDPCHWLAETPWWPDFQPRLVRNEPAILRFGWQPHQSLFGVDPADHVLDPLYHLDCVLHPLADRRRKAAEYEGSDPGLVAYGGGPLNGTFYEPELTATLRPWPVPDEDRPWIERVVAAEPDPLDASPGAAVPVVTIDEVDRQAPPVAFDEASYHACLDVIDVDLRLAPGQARPVLVRVRNTSGVLWPDAGDASPKLRLSYRLCDEAGRVIVADGVRTAMPRRLAPGAVGIVPMVVAAPPMPGRYLLQADLVDEGVRWFGCEATAAVTVAERWQRFSVSATPGGRRGRGSP